MSVQKQDRLKGLSIKIEKISKPWTLLALVGVMVVLAILMVSPLSPSEELSHLSGGINVPDAQFLRTPDQLYNQLALYGEHGRNLYLTRISPVDVFIPIFQALFLSVGLSLVLRRSFVASHPLRRLNLIPYLAMMADYLENAFIITSIVMFPMRSDLVGNLAMVFTLVKVVVSLGSLGLIPVFGIFSLLRKSVAK